MSVTVPIGIAVSTVLLTVLYFVLLPVFSVIVRFGDPLRKKLSRGGAESYWEDHKPYEVTLDRMERLFSSELFYCVVVKRLFCPVFFAQ